MAWMAERPDTAAKKEWKGGDSCGNSREFEGEIPAVIAGSLRVRFLR